MIPKSKIVVAAVACGVLIGAVTLSAQPTDPPAEPTPDVVMPAEQQAQISPEDMETRAKELTEQTAADRARIDQLKAEARKQKDIIKLNCINDKLVQVKQLMNILDDAVSRLQIAIATQDDAERYHRYTIVTVSAEKVRGLRDEAEACIGDELSYLGPLDIDVDSPDVVDDPTSEDPFDDFVIEPPGYASPFL